MRVIHVPDERDALAGEEEAVVAEASARVMRGWVIRAECGWLDCVLRHEGATIVPRPQSGKRLASNVHRD